MSNRFFLTHSVPLTPALSPEGRGRSDAEFPSPPWGEGGARDSGRVRGLGYSESRKQKP